MTAYIGIKKIWAEPEQREGVDGYKVVYEDGYDSWSPKNTFEKAYHESGKMSFSEALYALKRGAKIARSGRNAKADDINEMGLCLQSDMDKTIKQNFELKAEIKRLRNLQGENDYLLSELNERCR